MTAKFLVSNSIANNWLADKIVSISPDVLGKHSLGPYTTLIHNDEPYSVAEIADAVGLCLHTKKANQDETIWNKAVAQVQSDTDGAEDIWGNSLKRSSMSILILDRMNFKLSNDLWPGSINYLATFYNREYLDTVVDIDQKFNLTPIDDWFDMRKFDKDVNSKFKARDVIYFNDSDNHLITLCEHLIAKHKKLNSFTPETLRDKLLGQPWFILESMLLTDTNPWKLMDNNFAHVFERMDMEMIKYTEKQQDKVKMTEKNPQLIIVDMGLAYFDTDEVAEQKYKELCKAIAVKPNTNEFKILREIYAHGKQAIGKDPIEEKYQDIIESICKLLLGFENVKRDTELSQIGWHLGCQIAFKGAIRAYDETISLDFKGSEVIGDILDKII